MASNYSGLYHITARTPEKLKALLNAIPVPSTILSGSWYFTGSMHGVWVNLDRPVEMVNLKDVKPPKVEIKEQPKITKKER